ncbi:hypothetical protein ACSNOK_36270, partial [Streptomyces sp. URMC 126]|uniref:hypothetical protein n=1 Tax=Streptomyces sp. URMC 126 TaxID=3423401 RepID=UPI003F1D8815
MIRRLRTATEGLHQMRHRTLSIPEPLSGQFDGEQQTSWVQILDLGTVCLRELPQPPHPVKDAV